jgi:Flp pilus assembly pilin Flp
MTHRLVTFARDEDGAVTADWVILTASVVVLVLTAVVSLDRMSVRLAENIGAAVSAGDATTIANYDN